MSFIQTFPSGKGGGGGGGGEIQYDSLPAASASELGNIYQYTGTTTSSYTKGHFYECVYEDSAYKWKPIATQDGVADWEDEPIDFNDF